MRVKQLLRAATHQTCQSNLAVIFASSDEIEELENNVRSNPMLAQMAWQRFVRALNEFGYARIFVDTCGSAGSPLTSLALKSSKLAVIPFAPNSEYNMTRTMETVATCRLTKATGANQTLRLGVVFNKAEGRAQPETIRSLAYDRYFGRRRCADRRKNLRLLATKNYRLHTNVRLCDRSHADVFA